MVGIAIVYILIGLIIAAAVRWNQAKVVLEIVVLAIALVTPVYIALSYYLNAPKVIFEVQGRKRNETDDNFRYSMYWGVYSGTSKRGVYIRAIYFTPLDRQFVPAKGERGYFTDDSWLSSMYLPKYPKRVFAKRVWGSALILDAREEKDIVAVKVTIDCAEDPLYTTSFLGALRGKFSYKLEGVVNVDFSGKKPMIDSIHRLEPTVDW